MNGIVKVRISEAAIQLGVSIPTLRRWEVEGRIKADRTAGKHRRYDLASILGEGQVSEKNTQRVTVGYARVSSHDQKSDLARQVERLESFCSARGWTYEILTDLGSGLNYNKKGLKKLIQRICDGEISRLILTHKDRLLRFGSEVIFSVCEKYGTEVVIINASEELSFEQELATDVLEIITVFSARLYGSRSHKNKKILKSLSQVAHELRS